MIWRKITHFENYSINIEGQIRNDITNYIKKGTVDKHGYIRYNLNYNGKSKSFFAHRLVMETFSDIPENKIIVNHINGIKDDNRIENLEWVSYKENSIHAHREKLFKYEYKPTDKKCKLKENDILEIFYAEGKHSKIAAHFNVQQSVVSNIKNKKRWVNTINKFLSENDIIDFKILKETDLNNKINEKSYDVLLNIPNKVIENYPNYLIDISGNIYSLKNKKYLTPQISQDYYRIGLYNEKKSKTFFIHYLVAKHFIPNIENKPIINHIDSNKLNNNINNLEWCSYQENKIHSIKTQTTKSKKGEKNSNNKLTVEDVIDIYLSKDKREKIAKKHNISIWSVYDIKGKRTWSDITNNL